MLRKQLFKSEVGALASLGHSSQGECRVWSRYFIGSLNLIAPGDLCSLTGAERMLTGTRGKFSDLLIVAPF